jgi:Rab-GTPase-TBC domain
MWSVELELAVWRRFDHEMFCKNNHFDGHRKLRNVLLAYGRHDREVQYCQVSSILINTMFCAHFAACNSTLTWTHNPYDFVLEFDSDFMGLVRM